MGSEPPATARTAGLLFREAVTSLPRGAVSREEGKGGEGDGVGSAGECFEGRTVSFPLVDNFSNFFFFASGTSAGDKITSLVFTVTKCTYS